MKTCPHCGASLPTEASFCPSCAKSIQPRTEVIPPRHMPRRALYSALLVFLAAVLALALALWLSSRPKTYESDTGELLYTTHSGSWRLLLSKQDPPEPTPENHYHAVVDEAYRDPVPLYVMDPDSGAFLTEEFMENVASITAEISCSEEYLSISCTESAASDYYPSAAAVTFVDFRLVAPGDYEAELVYTVSMKNGDTLRLTQAKRSSPMPVSMFFWWTGSPPPPMSTTSSSSTSPPPPTRAGFKSGSALSGSTATLARTASAPPSPAPLRSPHPKASWSVAT